MYKIKDLDKPLSINILWACEVLMTYKYIVLGDDSTVNKVRKFISRRGVELVYSMKKGYVLFSGDEICNELIAYYSTLSVYKLEPIAAGKDADTEH